MGWSKWTSVEDEIVRAKYGTIRNIELAGELGRSEDSLKMRARVLGVAEAGAKPWTKEEDDYLREHYPGTGLKRLSERIGRSRGAISVRAARLGIVKTDEGCYDSVVASGDYGCPQVSVLTPFELGYVAGLLDGEGCITASIHRDQYTVLSVSIANTHKGVIDWLHKKLGGSVVVQPVGKCGRKRTCYWWMIRSGQTVLDFLRVIQPCLKIKSRQAQLVLQGWKPRMDAESSHSLVREIQALNRPTRLQ